MVRNETVHFLHTIFSTKPLTTWQMYRSENNK